MRPKRIGLPPCSSVVKQLAPHLIPGISKVLLETVPIHEYEKRFQQTHLVAFSDMLDAKPTFTADGDTGVGTDTDRDTESYMHEDSSVQVRQVEATYIMYLE